MHYHISFWIPCTILVVVVVVVVTNSSCCIVSSLRITGAPPNAIQRLPLVRHPHQQRQVQLYDSKNWKFISTSHFSSSLYSSVDNDVLLSSDFHLNDFAGSSRIDSAIKFDVEDSDDDTTDETLHFLKAIESIPRGQLTDDQIDTVRRTLSSVASSYNINDIDDVDMDDDTLHRMERLLTRWVEEIQDRSCHLYPSTNDFLLVMKFWEKRMGHSTTTDGQHISTAMERIRTLFSLWKECYHSSTATPLLKPNIGMYRIVFRAILMSEERQVDRKGERLLMEMQQDYQLEPDVFIYESLIYMLAKSRNDGAANRAERLLREAITVLQKQPSIMSHGTAKAMIGIDTFNVVITAWAKSGFDYGPERAEQIVQLMSDVNLEPNIQSFTSLIDAYAQSNTWDSANQCERIFNRVLDLYLNSVHEEEEKSYEPNIVSWSVVVSAWGRLAKNGHRGASDRADKLLRRMETLYKEGRISFGPDPILYVKCMNANACSQTMEGLHRATQILSEMHERFMDGDDRFMPTARSIHVLIENWVRSQIPSKMEEAEVIFNTYKDHIINSKDTMMDSKVVLNTIYKSMVIGWAQDGDPILAKECLQEMIDQDLTPEALFFEKIFDSNTQLNDSNSMKRSYATFQLLEECRLERPDFIPSERAYTAFIRAMTKAHIPNLAEKANTILHKMNDLYRDGNKFLKPTVFTYNAVLLACAESASLLNEVEMKQKTLLTAVTILNNLRLGTDGCELDSVSCGNVLRCSNLLPADSAQKDAFITSIFQLCCERSLVNYFVIRDLYLVASDDLKQQLLGTNVPLDDLVMEELPASWQRNAYKKPNKKSEHVATYNDSFRKGNRGTKPFQPKQRR
jgi:hypothetical protein